MLKKFLTVFVSLITLTYSAHAEMKVGGSIALALAEGDATVTEGGTVQSTGSDSDTRPLVQAFLEGQVPNAPISVGLAFMPLAEIADADGTVTDASVEVRGHVTLYLKGGAEIPQGGEVYFKAGLSRGTVKITDLATASGSSLTDDEDTLIGPTIGIGYEREGANDTFFRVELNHTQYDEVTSSSDGKQGSSNTAASNDTGKDLKADVDLTMLMFSFGKKF
tara:strand:+ start:43556 stop:44218 length:663 start_codon:yes stop_codon:yes gene_type:complete